MNLSVQKFSLSSFKLDSSVHNGHNHIKGNKTLLPGALVQCRMETPGNSSKVTRYVDRKLGQMASGSKISREQFLLLWVVTEELTKEEFDAEEFGLQNQISQAIQLLDKSKDFQSFLDVIKQRTVGGSGCFTPIRKQQREILETNPPRDHSGALQDSTVNSVLNKEVRCFATVTDGQLQHEESCRIKVILECKKDPRPACLPQVSMQEAAQVVAWVRQYPSDERQRVLVSQDHSEMYITFATYNDARLEYLDGKNVQGEIISDHDRSWSLYN